MEHIEASGFTVVAKQELKLTANRVDEFYAEHQGKGYGNRVMLLYDGVHYDLIVKELFGGAPEELDVCVFPLATGEADPATLPAAVTLTFAAPKPGHGRGEGPRLCGELRVVPIGVPLTWPGCREA